jgi:hypothetical protein
MDPAQHGAVADIAIFEPLGIPASCRACYILITGPYCSCPLMEWIFEYLDEDFYNRHTDFLHDQIDKHLEVIVEAVKFFGWKVNGKPHALNVIMTLWLEDPKDKNL